MMMRSSVFYFLGSLQICTRFLYCRNLVPRRGMIRPVLEREYVGL